MLWRGIGQLAWHRDIFRGGTSLGNASGHSSFFLKGGPGIPPQVEAMLIRCLREAGDEVILLHQDQPWQLAFQHLVGCEGQHRGFQLLGEHKTLARERLQDVTTTEELLELEHRGVRVGRFAASSALRVGRLASLEVEDGLHPSLEDALWRSIGAAEHWHQLVERHDATRLVVQDRGYTPLGELFDVVLHRGGEAITWNAGHRSDTLVFKRYTTPNRDEHPFSLSEPSWKEVLGMPWTPDHAARAVEEVERTYSSGDWYSEVGTQFGTRTADPEAIRRRLGIGTDRTVAGIFPHILWDATFFWGEDLYADYGEWLVETVAAAISNQDVDWIIKAHPANAMKNAREGIEAEATELVLLRERFGDLPDHIHVLDVDTDISTWSLLGLLDAVVTVRGTIGIEGAMRGVRVITAGTGRYDRRGFTVDADDRKGYEATLARLQDLEPMSAEELERARRFAYGVFLLRPLPLQAVSMRFRQDATASIDSTVRVGDEEAWDRSPDVRQLRDWLVGDEEDLLWHADAPARAPDHQERAAR